MRRVGWPLSGGFSRALARYEARLPPEPRCVGGFYVGDEFALRLGRPAFEGAAVPGHPPRQKRAGVVTGFAGGRVVGLCGGREVTFCPEELCKVWE